MKSRGQSRFIYGKEAAQIANLQTEFYKAGESMDDRILGSVIVAIGYTIAIIVVIWREHIKEKKHRKISLILFVLWMCAMAAYIIYHFLHY